MIEDKNNIKEHDIYLGTPVAILLEWSLCRFYITLQLELEGNSEFSASLIWDLGSLDTG